MKKHCTWVASQAAKGVKLTILGHQEILEVSQKCVETELSAQPALPK